MSSKHRSNASRNPGRPAGSLGRDARELLLTSAVELFAEQGVAATTFAMIAQRAGLTAAMVHYYFESRDQLLDAVVAEHLVPLITSVWGPIQPGEVDPIRMVHGFIDRLLDGIGRMPWIPPIWIREVLNAGGLLRGRVLQHIPRERVANFYTSIAKGQGKHTINPVVDPLLVVFSSLGLVMVHCATLPFVTKMFRRDSIDRETLKRHITALVLDGLRPRPKLQEEPGRRKGRERFGDSANCGLDDPSAPAPPAKRN